MNSRFFTDDGWFSPVPSCVRAVEESRKALEDLGHQLIPFQVPRPAEAVGMMVKCLMSDNGKYLLDSWKDDIVDENLKPFKLLISLPLCVRGEASFRD